MCPMCWPPGATTTCSPRTGAPGRADEMIAAVPPKKWRRISAGDGAPGPRDSPRSGCRSGTPGRPGGGLAARPPVPLRSGRDRLLHLRRTPAHHAHRTRSRRRIAVAGRGVLPAGQETRPAWTRNRGVPTVPGTPTPPCPCSHASLPPPGGKSADHLTPITQATWMRKAQWNNPTHQVRRSPTPTQPAPHNGIHNDNINESVHAGLVVA